MVNGNDCGRKTRRGRRPVKKKKKMIGSRCLQERRYGWHRRGMGDGDRAERRKRCSSLNNRRERRRRRKRTVSVAVVYDTTKLIS